MFAHWVGGSVCFDWRRPVRQAGVRQRVRRLVAPPGQCDSAKGIPVLYACAFVRHKGSGSNTEIIELDQIQLSIESSQNTFRHTKSHGRGIRLLVRIACLFKRCLQLP